MLSLTVVRVLLRIILFIMVRDILFCVLNEKKTTIGIPDQPDYTFQSFSAVCSGLDIKPTQLDVYTCTPTHPTFDPSMGSYQAQYLSPVPQPS